MKAVPEQTSERGERTEAVVDFCIRSLDRIGVSKRGKPNATRLWEEGRHAVSKFQTAVSIKIAIKDRQRNNSVARLKREKADGERRMAVTFMKSEKGKRNCFRETNYEYEKHQLR